MPDTQSDNTSNNAVFLAWFKSFEQRVWRRFDLIDQKWDATLASLTSRVEKLESAVLESANSIKAQEEESRRTKERSRFVFSSIIAIATLLVLAAGLLPYFLR